MNLLSRRSVLAIAAVVDVALHSRSAPVAAKALAARHKLPPRHLETLLQGLVHAKILKGVRGPRGGYELARERRRMSKSDFFSFITSLRPIELKAIGELSQHGCDDHQQVELQIREGLAHRRIQPRVALGPVGGQ